MQSMALMTSRVGDVVVKTLEDRRGWCTLPGCKCYSTSAIIVEFSDNICTYLLNAAQVNLIQYSQSCRTYDAGTLNHENDGVLQLLIICRHF